ncbi:KilA-N domain-containing protein, partial [Salmonella enterica]|nr:KilA-N domain-containing protein [Salmonella enterica]EKM0799144.1 KilA-N domain-containing protein [Salmonella enterica]
MSNIIPMNYDDRSFPFASDCWFNATVAAKHHGRKVTEWLRLPSTKEYMAELCQELGIEGFNYKGGIFPPLVRIEKGRYGGTWLHPELAVEFARWL